MHKLFFGTKYDCRTLLLGQIKNLVFYHVVFPNGEIGKIGGVRFVETTEAKIFDGTTPVYSTLVLGANAYGVTEVTGGGLRHIVKQLGSAGTADPLDQRATVGWKAIKTAEILVPNYMVRIESASSFASTENNWSN